MPQTRPTPRLLRGITDETVVRRLLAGVPMTRAEVAADSGLSKPAVAQSVERLVARGLVVETGERTTTRGGVGIYYALAPGAGHALAVAISAESIVAELLSPNGAVLGRAEAPIGNPVPADLSDLLSAVVASVLAPVDGGSVRVASVSAADPVDRHTGRLVHLPDAPFLVGSLDPVEVVGALVAGPVVVDNDVNWSARAERSALLAAGEAGRADDFVYLHLGTGLGCAVVTDGEVCRGCGGLAGEVAHILTRGRDGMAVAFTEVFAGLGVRVPESTAVDVPALADLVATDRVARQVVSVAVAGVIAATIGLTDPAAVVMGGTWGPLVAADVAGVLATAPRPVPVALPLLTAEPPLAGARADATARLVSDIVARAQA